MERREALELQPLVTHQVQVVSAHGSYVGLLSSFDSRLLWLADPEDPSGRPPLACISLGAEWGVRHMVEGCPACAEVTT